MGSVQCGLFATSRFDHCSPSSIADYFRQGAVVLNLTLALPGAVAHGVLRVSAVFADAVFSSDLSCKTAVVKAGITKNVTPHTLRHSFATGLLEAGVDLLTIGRLLGHTSFSTTMIYLHARRPHMESTPSPIDWLPVRQLPAWLQPPNRDKSNDQNNP